MVPFAYRAVDNGLAAIRAHAGRRRPATSGPGWPRCLLRVVLPAIRSAVLGAAFLTLALVLGEYRRSPGSCSTPTRSRSRSSRSGAARRAVAVALSLASLLIHVWCCCSLLSCRRRPPPLGRKASSCTDRRTDRRGVPPSSSRRPAQLRRASTPSTGSTSTIAPGELVALLGPSGCGKTTALRHPRRASTTPTRARSLVGGKDVTDVPANKRDMGMVFQAYSLFPHMTVRTTSRSACGCAGRGGGAAPAGRRDAGAGGARRRRRDRTRTSCPAASSSGSRWPGRWPIAAVGAAAGRAALRPRRQGARAAARRDPAGAARGGHHHRCSSRTTRRRRWRSRTGWRS